MFDLDEIDTRSLSKSGVAMTVRKLDGSPYINRNGEEVKLFLMGPDSEEHARLMRINVRKRLDRSSVSSPTDEQLATWSDEDERDTIEFLVAMTTGWKGVLDKGKTETIETPDGPRTTISDPAPIPFTKDAVRQLYRDFPVIRDQADAFIGRRANFIKAPSKAS